MTGDMCKNCQNFEPCPCEEVADQETTCVNCGVRLFVPAWALRGYLVTCYDHRCFDSIVGTYAPMPHYQPPTAGDVEWVNSPVSNWGGY